MTWRNESERHQLASRGISTKENKIATKNSKPLQKQSIDKLTIKQYKDLERMGMWAAMKKSNRSTGGGGFGYYQRPDGTKLLICTWGYSARGEKTVFIQGAYLKDGKVLNLWRTIGWSTDKDIRWNNPKRTELWRDKLK